MHAVRCLVGSGGSPSRHGMTCCCDVSCGLWRLAKPSWHDLLSVRCLELACSWDMAWRPAKRSACCEMPWALFQVVAPESASSQSNLETSFPFGATLARQHGGRRPVPFGVPATAWAASAATAVAASPAAAVGAAATAAATATAAAAAASAASDDVQSSASPWTGSGFAGRRWGCHRAGRSRLEGDPAGRPE